MKNVNNDSNYVYVNSVKLSFGIPALLLDSNGKIETDDIHEGMIDALMKLKRCNEYIGGHWDNIVFEYTSIKMMHKYMNIDFERVRNTVDRYFKRALRK